MAQLFSLGITTSNQQKHKNMKTSSMVGFVISISIALLSGCASSQQPVATTSVPAASVPATAGDLTGYWRLVSLEGSAATGVAHFSQSVPIFLQQTGSNLTGTESGQQLTGTSDGINVAITNSYAVFSGRIIDGYHMQGDMIYIIDIQNHNSSPIAIGTWTASRTSSSDKGWSQRTGNLGTINVQHHQ